jgi:hypothetical protein
MWIAKEADVVDWTNVESVMDSDADASGRVAQTIKMRRSTDSIDRIEHAGLCLDSQ